MTSGERADRCRSLPTGSTPVGAAFGTLWVQRGLPLGSGTATWAELFARFGPPQTLEDREASRRAVREAEARFAGESR